MKKLYLKPWKKFIHYFGNLPYRFELIFLFSTFLLINSCKLEDSPNSSILTFETSSISHLEDAGSREIKIKIEPSSSINSIIPLTVTLGSGVVYGEDFTSNPPVQNSKIELPVQRGDTEVKFSITTINNDIIDGNKTITFKIDQSTQGFIQGERNTLFFNIIDTDVAPDPEIFLNVDLLEFGDVIQLQESDILSYQLSKVSIESEIEIIAPSGFQIGKSTEDQFSETKVFSDEDFENGTVSVYVKFTPSILDFGIVSGLIQHNAVDVLTLAPLPVIGNAVENPEVSTLQWIENFDYTGEWLPGLPNSGSTSTNQEVSIDEWISVRSGRDGIAMADEFLVFDGYPGSGTGRSIRLFHDGTNATDDNFSRNLKNYVVSDENDIVTSEFSTTYISFMVKLEENIMSGRSTPVILGTWNTNGNGTTLFNSRVVIDVKEGGAGSLGVQYPNPPSTILEEDVIEVGKTYLIVFQNERIDGPGNDISSIFLFEQGDDIPNQEPQPLISVVTSGIERDMEVLILEEAQARNKMIISGIRVANSWRDLF